MGADSILRGEMIVFVHVSLGKTSQQEREKQVFSAVKQ